MDGAREREHSKYLDLVEAGRTAGFQCELVTLEVGSRGMLSLTDLEPLQQAIEATRKEVADLFIQLICTTIYHPGISQDLVQQKQFFITHLLS